MERHGADGLWSREVSLPKSSLGPTLSMWQRRYSATGSILRRDGEKPTDETAATTISVNFSADGGNWSGWRVPQSTAEPLLDYLSTPRPPLEPKPNAPPGLAPVNNHLYILAPGDKFGDTNNVWAY